MGNPIALLRMDPSLNWVVLGPKPAAVLALETNLNNELSPELESFIVDFCSQLDDWKYSLDGDACYGVVSVLSLLPDLCESHLVATEIIR